MLTQQTIESLEKMEQARVKTALIILAETGVLEKHIETMQKGVVAQFNSTDVELLARDIVEIRQQTKALQGLHNLGKQFMMENKNA